MEERIILALDLPNKEKATELLDTIGEQVRYVKVGMELFYKEGFPLIELLKKRGLNIFLDLKLHDIPNTVGNAIAQLTKMEVDMLNVHVAGGVKMMEAAKNGLEKGLTSGQKKPSLIGVTQLTSTDERMLKTEIGIPLSVEQSVRNYAKLAKLAGLDGVVASPLEVEAIKKECGHTFLTVTPGIRLAGDNSDDQKRITTPKQAFDLGTDFIVIGRSIRDSIDPKLTFKKIISSL